MDRGYFSSTSRQTSQVVEDIPLPLRRCHLHYCEYLTSWHRLTNDNTDQGSKLLQFPKLPTDMTSEHTAAGTVMETTKTLMRSFYAVTYGAFRQTSRLPRRPIAPSFTVHHARSHECIQSITIRVNYRDCQRHCWLRYLKLKNARWLKGIEDDL